MVLWIIIHKIQCMCCDLFKLYFRFYVVCYLCVKSLSHLIEKKNRNCWHRHPCNILEWQQKNNAIYQNNKYTSLKNKEVEPVKPVQMNINQSNTYRKDLSWLHFYDESRIQQSRQVKDQWSCISVFVAYPAIPNSN